MNERGRVPLLNINMIDGVINVSNSIDSPVLHLLLGSFCMQPGNGCYVGPEGEI